jgi:hypothetical protein
MPTTSSRLITSLRAWFIALVTLVACHSASAQWVTESYALKPGWNAVWLPLDVSHDTIDSVAHPNITEIWKWNNYGSTTFIDNAAGDSSQVERQWEVWRRADLSTTTFSELTGNTAYLVKVANTTSSITWAVKGKPLSPHYDWTSSGTNLIGFPLETPANGNLRGFAQFFGFDAVLKSKPKTYFYNGGALSSDTVRITQDTAPLNRFQAYWVQAGSYTEYYGPIKVALSSATGFKFGTDTSSISINITNVVEAAKNLPVTVTLAPLASEVPPSGQTAISGLVPIKIRGALDLATGTYSYTTVDAAHPITLVLQPGASQELVFTVDRSQMNPQPGLAYQSLIKITDSLNQTRIMLPVTAETTPRTGLWLGTAILNQADVVVGVTKTHEAAPSTFPLRLILHSDADGQVRLLQEAYTGMVGSQIAVGAREESFVAPNKPLARVASSQFPIGTRVNGSGALGLTTSVSFNFTLGYNDPSNPFVHTYHPDHDNMDERFQTVLPAGRESSNITRSITLTFTAQNPNGFDPTWGATVLGGTYSETVTGLRAVPIKTSGVFALKRAADAPTFLP